MKYLSFDIGIKNLAYCIINENKIIEDWGIINIVNEEPIHKCSEYNKNKNKCNSNATYKNKHNQYSCNKHYKILNDKSYKIIKKINANKIDLEILGISLIKKLKEIDNFKQCEHIILENQPVLKNPKMKSIQMIVYSYFLMLKLEHNIILKIKMFLPKNKLNIYDGPKLETLSKNKYDNRKKQSIIITKYILEKYNEQSMILYLNNHSKKDDLCDSYLQGLCYIDKLK